MDYEITSGVLKAANKVIIYGPEGVGKTSLAANFPDPLFIDTEGSTKKYNVKRLPKPSSWEMLKDEVQSVIRNRNCSSLVIDTADWAERLCIESVCQKHGKSGVEDFGYGNGYTYVAEEWGRFLNLLQDVVDVANINVVLNAHAIIRKFEQPNEMGAYDRYELKLGKKTTGQTAPITKEWADMILFLNYKTYSVAVDDKGKKHKAQGGQRVMYTTHHPCWDAKNRDGLPEELPLDYSSIAHIFENIQTVSQPVMETVEPQPLDNLEPVPSFDEMDQKINDMSNELDPAIPVALRDLMNANKVTEKEIVKVVANRGYFPADMKIRDYPSDFIDGVLVGAWEQVLAMILTERQMQF